MGVPVVDLTLSDQEQNLNALDRFSQLPHSFGIDNLKESFRNLIILMLELKGYDTGRALEHLYDGSHEGLSMSGARLTNSDKKRKKQEFEDAMALYEKLSLQSFSSVFSHVEKKLENVKNNIDEKIEALDAQLEEKADTAEEAAELKRNNKRRKRLFNFKRRVQQYEIELDDASTTEQVLDIEQSLHEDVVAFDNPNAFFPPARKPQGIAETFKQIKDGFDNVVETSIVGGAAVAGAVKSERDKARQERYEAEQRERWARQRHGYNSSDESTDGSGDSTTGDDGTGDQEEDPEPPSIDL